MNWFNDLINNKESIEVLSISREILDKKTGKWIKKIIKKKIGIYNESTKDS